MVGLDILGSSHCIWWVEWWTKKMRPSRYSGNTLVGVGVLLNLLKHENMLFVVDDLEVVNTFLIKLRFLTARSKESSGSICSSYFLNYTSNKILFCTPPWTASATVRQNGQVMTWKLVLTPENHDSDIIIYDAIWNFCDVFPYRGSGTYQNLLGPNYLISAEDYKNLIQIYMSLISAMVI